MAKTAITLSDAAPDEPIHFTFASGDFSLTGKKKFYTDDNALISEAEAHSFLVVTRPESDQIVGSYREQLAPEDDHLSAQGTPFNPLDADQAAEAEAAKMAELGVNVPVADPTPTEDEGPAPEADSATPTSKDKD